MAERTSPSHRSDDSYALIIDNIPPGGVWQDLKDLTRRDGVIGRRSVVEKKDEMGFGIGQIEIPDKTQAFSALNRLIEEGWNGKKIRIALVRIRPGEQLVQLVKPTPGPRRLTQARHSANSPGSAAAPSPTFVDQPAVYVDSHAYPALQPFPAFDVLAGLSIYPGPALATYDRHARVGPQPVAAAAATHLACNVRPTSTYHTSRHTTSSTPVQRSLQHPVPMANRSLFLANLPFNVSRTALRETLQDFGRLVHFSTWHDSQARLRNGAAKATFESIRDAAAAVKHLNGCMWGAGEHRREIRCHFDRDAMACRPRATRPRRSEPRRRVEEPIIVDGSRGPVDSDHSEEGSGSEEGGYSSSETVREVSRAMRHVRV